MAVTFVTADSAIVVAPVVEFILEPEAGRYNLPMRNPKFYTPELFAQFRATFHEDLAGKSAGYVVTSFIAYQLHVKLFRVRLTANNTKYTCAHRNVKDGLPLPTFLAAYLNPKQYSN